MTDLPEPLRTLSPVTVAPMAGGASTPALVIAASRAGHFAQLAGGYKSAEVLQTEIRAVTAAGSGAFGVNLFVPNPSPVDPAEYRMYAAALTPTAERLGISILPDITEDDDGWDAKVAFLLRDPVPVVSFTFGLPSRETIDAFRAVGTVTLQTVTSAADALAADALGIDVLVLQGPAAGGHSAVLDPGALPGETQLTDLIRLVAAVTALPIIAAGGIATAAQVTAALEAGAQAVAVGTAVLRTPESGASPVHKDALGDPRFTATTVTRAFTGRPARALVNRFITDVDSVAPVGYPALHHLTRPIRAAATTAGDPSAVNLWAGAGWTSARVAPVAEVLASLAPHR
ncbi:MAG: nitronate monooxygenase [Burkholderiaceae bacterium]|nr:nitronate monooxygenase [Microbacteriaceae bacterium]